MISPVWWFYTIVLGMAFAQVAQSLAVQAKRARLDGVRRPHAPTILWEVFLLLLVVQVWVAVGYYRDTLERISVLELAAFLVVPLGIFLLATILGDNLAAGVLARESGDGDAESAEGIRERAFERLRPLFFGTLIAMIAINLVHAYSRGDLEPNIDLAVQLLLVAGAVIGLFLTSRRADTVLAAAMIVVLAAYIAIAYGTLSVNS